MARTRNPHFVTRWPLVAGAVAATAVAVHFGFGLHPSAPAAYLLWLPMFLLGPRTGMWITAAAALAGWLLGALAFTDLWEYVTGDLNLSAGVAVFQIGAGAVLFVAVVLLFRALARIGWSMSAIIGTTGLAVGLDHLQGIWLPAGATFSLATSQAGQSWLLPITSVLGRAGLVALIVGLPALVAVAVTSWVDRPKRRQRLAMNFAVGLVLVMIAVGGLILAGRQTVKSDAVTRVVAAAGLEPPRGKPVGIALPGWGPALSALRAGVQAAQRKGARVVVFGEETFATSAETLATLARAAASPTTHVALGTVLHSPGWQRFNWTIIFHPRILPDRYVKQHSTNRRDTPGRRALVMKVRSELWSVATGTDLNFPATIATLGRDHVRLLLVPAADTPRSATLHRQLAILSAAENGMAMVRSARGGRLTITDPLGRVLTDQASRTGALATATTTFAQHRSLYAKFGNWFAWLMLAAAGMVTIRVIRRSI